jgi:hypothetical protein
MAKLADQKLETLGGQRVHTLGLGDDDANLEDDFITWKEAFWAAVCSRLNIEASNEEFNTRQYEHKVRGLGGGGGAVLWIRITLMRIRIRLFVMIRIRIQILA